MSGRPGRRDRDSHGTELHGDDSAAIQPMEKQSFHHTNSRDVFRQFTAGAAAGCVAKTVVAPLDRVKIMFQVSQRPFSAWAGVQQLINIVKLEGITALYKGNSAAMFRVVPYSGIQLMTFDQYSKVFLRHRDAEKDARLTSVEKLLAGAMAGATSVIATYPLDVMRARLAVQRVFNKYDSLSHALRVTFAEEGIIGLYRGVVPTLAGILPYAGLSFYTFETTKHFVTDTMEREPNAFERLVCGGLAGLVGQTSTYPLDVIRRRMQTESFILHHLEGKGWSEQAHPIPDHAVSARVPGSQRLAVVEYSGDSINVIFRRILEREGIRGLYKGITMNIVKGPIAVGFSFATFDLTKKWLGV